jgi:hypothetical protein
MSTCANVPSGRHRRMVKSALSCLSNLPALDARRLPSGDQANCVTQSVCPVSNRLATKMEAVGIGEGDGIRVGVGLAIIIGVARGVGTLVGLDAAVAGWAVASGGGAGLTKALLCGLAVG